MLRFDLIGRGLSSSAGDPETARLFSTQLSELLYKLDVQGGVDLIGYSLGGGVVIQYASSFHAKLNSLTLLAPVGATVKELPFDFIVPLVLRFQLFR